MAFLNGREIELRMTGENNLKALEGWEIRQELTDPVLTALGVSLKGLIQRIGEIGAVSYYHIQGYPGTVLANCSYNITAGRSTIRINYPDSCGKLVYLRGTALTAGFLAEGHHMVIFIEGSNNHWPVICYDDATPGGQFDPPEGNTIECVDFIIGFETV